MKNIFYGIIVIAVLIFGVPNIFKGIRSFFSQKDWKLNIYSTSSPDSYSVRATIPGYSSLKECSEKGFEYTLRGGSYECSYGCGKTKDYYGDNFICERVCSKNGCRE